MKKYTILCTPEQTMLALKLGAPVMALKPGAPIKAIVDFRNILHIPTAEQLIGWLEDKTNITEVFVTEVSEGWYYVVEYKVGKTHDAIVYPNYYDNRKEATIAAIDAALKYLTYNKE